MPGKWQPFVNFSQVLMPMNAYSKWPLAYQTVSASMTPTATKKKPPAD
jgi:hypothetical protein